jgi:hypothetical protein
MHQSAVLVIGPPISKAVEAPDLLPGAGIQGHYAELRRRGIHHAVDDNGITLDI